MISIKKYYPGNNLGIKITYAEQDKPRGLADAFILGNDFIKKDNVSLILGDNFFYGQNLSKELVNCAKLKKEQKFFYIKLPNLNYMALLK